MNAYQKYRDSFGLSSADNNVTKMALKQALDIRKFEIDLYWKRATYFWTLIAATFAGYFAVLASEKMPDKNFNACVLACVGLIFSLAWYLSNRGSKYWQENWEYHVDMLEDQVTGPLYKTVLHRPKADGIFVRFFESPAPFSVSQINQWVSLFTIAVWLPLLANVLPVFDLSYPVSWKHFTIGVITVVAAIILMTRTRSNIEAGIKHSTALTRHRVLDN